MLSRHRAARIAREMIDLRRSFRRPASGRVSVVIPLYNHAAYIAEAVRSVLDQGPILRELIVVDDGSTDGSAEVMRDLCRADSRVVFWSQENRGAHAALNAGLLRAGGEFLAVLNSDDAYLPGRLAALAEALDRDPLPALAASEIAFMDAQGDAVGNPWYEDARQFLARSGDMALSLVQGNLLMTTSNYLFRRTLLEEMGGFAPLRYAHDLDFALRLLARGGRIALLPRTLLRYRIHPANTIAEAHDRVRLEWAAATAFFLHRLWDCEAGGPIDWARMRAFADVLERHALTRPVQMMMAWLRRHPASSLEHCNLLRDAAMLAQIDPGVR
jgi:glycosyltransferase involved in cell wall biosynthesis